MSSLLEIKKKKNKKKTHSRLLKDNNNTYIENVWFLQYLININLCIKVTFPRFCSNIYCYNKNYIHTYFKKFNIENHGKIHKLLQNRHKPHLM